MNKILIILVLVSSSFVVNGQAYKDLLTRLNTFDKFEQYDSVDLEILEVANYLLSTPIQRKDYTEKFYYAAKSLVKWSNHTEGYKILSFGKIYDACGNDALMKNMFMAAVAQYLLDQRYKNNRHIFPEKQPDINYGDLPEVKETLLEAAKIFLDYLEHTSGERPNKELRNGIKAANEGTLETYMFK